MRADVMVYFAAAAKAVELTVTLASSVELHIEFATTPMAAAGIHVAGGALSSTTEDVQLFARPTDAPKQIINSDSSSLDRSNPYLTSSNSSCASMTCPAAASTSARNISIQPPPPPPTTTITTSISAQSSPTKSSSTTAPATTSSTSSASRTSTQPTADFLSVIIVHPGSKPSSSGSIPSSSGSIPPSSGSIPPSSGSIPPSSGSIPPSSGATATQTKATIENDSTAENANGPGSSHSSAFIGVGISAGLAAVTLLSVLIYFLSRRRQNLKKRKDDKNLAKSLQKPLPPDARFPPPQAFRPNFEAPVARDSYATYRTHASEMSQISQREFLIANPEMRGHWHPLPPRSPYRMSGRNRYAPEGFVTGGIGTAAMSSTQEVSGDQAEIMSPRAAHFAEATYDYALESPVIPRSYSSLSIRSSYYDEYW
ncbi:hypothetical protein QQS21_011528 [Conoideocrella luteorostrata]|uniref:Uncharacterized protein n=1 Tax=Conoideocrella luteorostrata TaxID=1105319 RepID=A0AAJ0CD74_9HYPO|nr:hypothetical protein QQS21_011528 [Conoideocrella luteorostrata]